MNREDFPILSQLIYNRPLVYLDNAATTLKKPFCVYRSMIYNTLKNSVNAWKSNERIRDLYIAYIQQTNIVQAQVDGRFVIE